jgi:DNA-binding NarL/FixJ family response regulator
VTSVLVVDDQDLVRSGFRLILEAAGIEVLGEAGDGAPAVALARELVPDVVLMDVRMPGMDGIEATRRIRADAPDEGPPRVLILTTFDLDEYVFDALRAGASGFLLKDAPRRQLVEAVEVVAAGQALLAPSVTRRLIAEFSAAGTRPAGGVRDERSLATLTARERETLELLAEGLTNGEIAARMFVGEATVKTHVGNVLMKLGLRDRVQAVIFAYEHGIVSP